MKQIIVISEHYHEHISVLKHFDNVYVCDGAKIALSNPTPEGF